jgi:hypothetical protein
MEPTGSVKPFAKKQPAPNLSTKTNQPTKIDKTAKTTQKLTAPNNKSIVGL